MPFRLNNTSSSSSSSGTSDLDSNVTCDAGVTIGDAVRIDGSNVAQKAQADTFANAHVYGFVNSKPTSTSCNIVLNGLTGSIFSSLDPTKQYFLSQATAGAITDTAPVSGVIAPIGKPKNTTILNVQIGNRLEI